MGTKSVSKSGQSQGKRQQKKQDLEQTLQHYTSEFQSKQAAYEQQNGKTAEAVLELCKVVYDASSALKNKSYLKDFRDKNGLHDKGTFSQFKTIGANYARLSPHANRLPSSWYTLYKIAKLDGATFTSAMTNGQIHPLTTQRNVRELGGLGNAALKPRASAAPRYVIELGETDGDRIKEFDDEIEMVAKELATDGYAFNITRSDELKKLLKGVSSRQKAA
jgi:hypothetical protein